MASKRRKRTLPPWLCGVAVSQSNTGSKKLDTCTLTNPEATAHKTDIETDAKKPTLSPPGERKPTLSPPGERKPTLSPPGERKPADKDCSNIPDGSRANHKPSQGNKVSNIDTVQNVNDIVAMSYKEYIFSGTLIYSHNMDDCNILCDDIISEMTGSSVHVIGFDTEWPVLYEKGRQAKTALVQICTSVDKCYLFHLSCMPKFPIMLKKLLEMSNVKKVGLNVEMDLWKLEMDYDFKAKEIVQTSTVELKTLANRKLKSSENWSLEGLTRNVLRLRISKDPSVRKCDWSQYPLPEKQQLYAATDAAVSLMVYQKLCTPALISPTS